MSGGVPTIRRSRVAESNCCDIARFVPVITTLCRHVGPMFGATLLIVGAGPDGTMAMIWTAL